MHSTNIPVGKLRKSPAWFLTKLSAMAQRPLAPEKQGKLFLGSSFRVLESPHASPCLSFASPSGGYSFNPMPPMSLGELSPGHVNSPVPHVVTSGHVTNVPQIRPGGSVLDLIPTPSSPTWTTMPRDEKFGSPGPDPKIQHERPRPAPLQGTPGMNAVLGQVAHPQVVPQVQSPFARQSPPGSPVFARQFSPPGSPAWTTVSNPRRKPADAGGAVRPAVQTTQEPVLRRLPTTGDSVDMYYDQKEMFVKGWTKEAKSTRSVKQKKRVDYQVEKRRQQSARDRGVEDDLDDFVLDE